MALLKSLDWYRRRLSVMGPREIGHRLVEQAGVQALRWKRPAASAREPAGFAFCTSTTPCLPELPWDFDASAAIAAGLAEGRWPALGFDWQWTGDPSCWHRAPDTGAAWPRDFFASIPYRAGNPLGDVRVAWEPARLQQLIGLALLARAQACGREADALRLLEDQFLSWTAANEPYRGIHYLSAMECALRLVAVCHALDLVRDRLVRRDEVWRGLVALVESHAGLITRRLSLHSSAGNHTIAECAGLVYAGVLFPEFEAAARWKDTGLGLLAQEAERQVLADGGGLEQSFWYLGFVADLCGLVQALLSHRGLAVPDALAAAVVRARRFLDALADPLQRLPDVGDRDDGHALAPWLALSRPRAGEHEACVSFPEAGYTRLATRGALRLDVLFDHGPLGMPPLFAHGHADALSVAVDIGGRRTLLDTGTCTYGGDPAWRRYFRSTAAHNTVTVDGEDQAVQDGAFAWAGPYTCELVRLERDGGHVRVLARHDGYRSLGVVHWRGIAIHPDLGLLVWDHVAGTDRHQVQLHWHGEGLVPSGDRCWALGEARLAITGADDVRTVEGGTPDAASGGWQSPRYGVRRPIVTILAWRDGPLPCELETRLMPARAPPEAAFADDIAAFRQWLGRAAPPAPRDHR